MNLARAVVLISALAIGLAFGATANAEPIRIAAFGDSNTAAYMVGKEKGYPADLERLLRAKGYDVAISNGGVSGAKSADGVRTVDQLVPAGTDIAIVFFGRNDKRWAVKEEDTRANIDAIVARLTARHIEVLLAGYWAYDFSTIARAHGATYYPQFFDGVAVNGVKLPQYRLTFDPLQHLNAAGYGVVAEHIAPAVEGLVAKVQAAR
jgi:acyl-CoA thioesterase-1